jgi:hypothetical protein
MESSFSFENVSLFPFDITAKEGDVKSNKSHKHKHKLPCLIVSQFLYLSFVTIIRETKRLCRKLEAILYLAQFPHFCTHTDMIRAYKVLICINSCYTANKVLTSHTKRYSVCVHNNNQQNESLTDIQYAFHIF